MRNLIIFVFFGFAAITASAQSTVSGKEQVDSSAAGATDFSLDNRMTRDVQNNVTITDEHYITGNVNSPNENVNDRMKLVSGSSGPSSMVQRDNPKARTPDNSQQNPNTIPPYQVTVNGDPANQMDLDKNKPSTIIKP